jgi:formate dehydrogenase iron-sulfur subunit
MAARTPANRSSKAMLIDLTRCIGCRGCQAACKQWHDLPAEKTTNLGSYENPQRISARTWTTVSFDELELDNQFHWVFAKRQCMHCDHPGCVSACTVGALRKTPEGPVVYDSTKCIGCRYCQYACPYGVPAYEWDETLGLIGKCDFCADRQAEGLEPACVKTCPTEALIFGDREELLAEARRRIIVNPDDYVDHIYGETEAGGASMLYLSGVPFAALGFPKLGDQPVSVYAESVMRQTPVIALGVAAGASALYWIIKRRELMKQPLSIASDSSEEVKS